MNHKRLKKMGALLLAIVMLLGMLPGVQVVAAEEFGVAFSMAYAKVGEPMTVTVSGASGSVNYSWTVDGYAVGSDASYTPTEDDLMKWIAVTVTSGKDSATAEMFFSKLPVVYINTENGAAIVSKEDYIDAELIIQGNETYNSGTTTLYNGVTEIRGRGNSTWAQPKKPYKLKLDKKTDVFGMGKNKHWVLLANYLDESLLRNTLAYDLSGNMGMEQMSTVFVDVILNGEFIGNYQFCEQIRVDGTRVDVFDWEGFCEDSAGVIADAEGMSKSLKGDLEEYMLENMGWITSGTVKFNGTTYTIANYPDIEIPDINGGYLIELDEYYDEISKFKTNYNQPIMFKSPEFLNTNSDMMNFVKNYIQAFEDAVHADSYTAEYEGETVHYSELYDFDALVDYWLINEIFFNEELNKKSTYMYKDIDSLMYMGPIWDMDWSSGGEGQTYHTEQWAVKYYSTNAQANNWYKYLIQDPYFIIKAQERYWEIRNAQVADMMTQIDDSYELLKESAAANGKRWGYRSDYKKYVDDLRNWFNNHLTWLDTQMATQESLRTSLGYSASSRLALTLTDASGNALPADTARTAPADAVATVGQTVKLTVQGGNNTDGNAVLYVNSRRTSVTAVNANSTYTLDVPAEALNAPEGEKNVLEIQIEKADGSINASRYVTVIVGGEHEHDYEATVTAPTCTEGGYTTYICTCGDSYVADETAALGHTEQIIPGTPATFDDKGTSDGVICAACGETLVEQETVPVLDYNEGIVPLSALIATAGDWQTGYEATEGPAELVLDDDFGTIWHTDWKGTSRENHWIQFELTDTYTVDGLRYKPRQTGNSNGTITEYEIQVSEDGENFRTVDSGSWENDRNWKVASFDGENVKFVRLVAVYAVSDNNYVFASAAEIRLTGAKTGGHVHNYVADVTEPTCLSAGFTTYTCSCGDSYIADEVDALGHEYVTEVVEPTCTKSGYTIYTCVRCGKTYKDDPVEPGHKWNEGAATAPTCTELGYTTYTCTVCALEYVDEASWLPATGHTEEIIPSVAATCTETGLTEGKKCSVCNEILVAQEIILATGHSWKGTGCENCDETRENPFVDVDEKVHASFFDAILWAVEEGITTGTDATHFNPNGKCDRATIVTFLWRAAGKPEPTTTENPFVDVKESHFFYKAVLWAYENGITTGIDATHFNPYGKCTRAQVVTFLWRAEGKPAPTSTESTFSDVTNAKEFYYNAVLWAAENGITNGINATTFGVNSICNRAQVVTFLYRCAK